MPTRFRCLLILTATLLFATVASAQPPTNIRWTGSTASTQTQGLAQGDPLKLTWGFMAEGTVIDDAAFNGIPTAVNAPSNLKARLNTIYGSQAVWQPHFQSVFDRWSSVSGLSYQFEAADDGSKFTNFSSGQTGVRADIRIGGKNIDGNSGVLAYNYFPDLSEMVIDTNDNTYTDTSNSSRLLRNIVSHEHGHGLGMNHVVSNNATFLMEPFIDLTFDGPQFHDILAAQHQYGDAGEKSNSGLGNDTAARANTLVLDVGGKVKIGQSAKTLVVAANSNDFVSIDSATDTDFHKFDVSSAGKLDVLLEALGFEYNITAQGPGLMGDVAFDTRRRSNLTLSLFDTDGTTLLETANIGGLGENESISFDLTAGGTYFVRVTGADNPDSIALDAQFYGLSITFVPVPEPATMLLCSSAVLVGGWRWKQWRKSRASLA